MPAAVPADVPVDGIVEVSRAIFESVLEREFTVGLRPLDSFRDAAKSCPVRDGARRAADQGRGEKTRCTQGIPLYKEDSA